MRNVSPTTLPIPNGHAPTNAPVMTGADIFVRALEAEGVEVIFGHPGGAVIKIYDAIDYLKPRFHHVLVRHEQAGTHAAEGYAKATGKVGTVLVTSGPGATNCVTGIADAWMDSVPIVVFTGQVPTHLIGNDAFQETDTIGITRSITKHNFLVRDVRDLAWTIRAAYHIARTGRPGPVVVDLPKDVLAASAPFYYPEHVHLRGYRVPYDPSPEKIEKALQLLAEAERPLLYVGGGVIGADAAELVTELARRHRIPVATTLHGIGAFPEDDPLSLGMLGMHGTWYANQAVQHADLIVALGARFDDRVTGRTEAWAPHARVIHVEIDHSCISKNIWADCAIRADVRRTLEVLLPEVRVRDTSAWLAQINQWKEECPLTYERGDGALRPQYIMERISELTRGEAIVVTDVGQNQMWAAQYYTYRYPRTHITSGGLGTMGFSLPAAMGAALGRPDRTVVSINGDGGFMMNVQDLGTIVWKKLPIKIFVINNGFLGMVRQWQELFHENRYSHTDLTASNPDFVRLAEAFGCPARRITRPEEVDSVLEWAWSVHDGPVLIEAQVIPEEMVFPMVPAGAATHEMIVQRPSPFSTPL